MTKRRYSAAAAVDQDSDGTWRFTCPHPAGCGADGDDGHVSFISSQWPQKGHAVARGQEHLDEHDTGLPAQELVDFRAMHKVVI